MLDDRTADEIIGYNGKGHHPKARLNLGDCCAYALAKTRNLPLLFKGADFAATGIAAAF